MSDPRLRPGEAGFSVRVEADTDTARAQVEAVVERALLAAGMRRLPPVRHLHAVPESRAKEDSA